MKMAVYILIVFFPFIFLMRRPVKEVMAVFGLVALFLLIQGRMFTGQQGVAWDTLYWETVLQYVKTVVQAGYLPGWNPHFDSGEPLYLYNFAYTFWQWFLFVAVDYLIPIKPAVLFNVFFLSLYVLYNVGCYLFFRKIFTDTRVVFFALAASLFSMNYVMFLFEYASLYFVPYFPFLLYVFLEFVERKKMLALLLIPAILGLSAAAYVPHFTILGFAAFVAAYFIFMDRKYYGFVYDRRPLIYLAIGSILLFALLSPQFYVFLKLKDYFSPMRAGIENMASLDRDVLGNHQTYKSIFAFVSVSDYSDRRLILFVGFIPLVLAGIGVFKSSNRFRWVVLFALTGIFFLSFGRNGIFYPLIQYLPTFASMRNYVAFEIFVQLFLICLAGMGLEFLLDCQESVKKSILFQLALIAVAVFVFFVAAKYAEMKAGNQPYMPGMMSVTAFVFSFGAICLLMSSRTWKSYYFFMFITVLMLGNAQWYLGDLKFNEYKKTAFQGSTKRIFDDKTHDDGEAARLAEVLDKDHSFIWRPFRRANYKQKLVIADYNSFEPALENVEITYSEYYERNLFINKRYYSLRPLQDTNAEYFGVGHPKLFVTDDYRVLPEDKDVIQAMRESYKDYITSHTVFFAKQDIESVKEKSAGNWSELAYARQRPQERVIADMTGAKVNVSNYGPNGLSMNVNSPKDAFLVYLQNYDDDWHAYVDGVETPVYRVNYNFQAVRVPRGMSKVELRFETAYGYIFLLYLAGAVTVNIVMAFFFCRKDPREREA